MTTLARTEDAPLRGAEEVLDAAPVVRVLPRPWVLLEDHVLVNVATAIMLGAMGVMFYEAVNRSLFSTSHWWAEELVRFMVVWSVLLALVPAARHHHFIRMDLLVQTFPRWLRLVLAGLNALCGLAFAAWLTHAGWLQVQHMQRIRMMTDSNLDLPMWQVLMVLPVGGALYALHFVGALYAILRGHDPSESIIS